MKFMDKKRLIGAATILIIFFVVGFFLFEKYDLSKRQNSQIANPASEYCVAQGNKLEIRDNGSGQAGYCIYGGQECEEWAYYRGECSFEGKQKCVAKTCCHASECVLESDAPDCHGALCTLECRAGTMDCGAGRCGFVDGKCEVIWNEK